MLDFDEIYDSVVRIETLRLVVAVTSEKGWTLSQLDDKFVFLNGPLERKVFRKQPPSFEKK